MFSWPAPPPPAGLFTTCASASSIELGSIRTIRPLSPRSAGIRSALEFLRRQQEEEEERANASIRRLPRLPSDLRRNRPSRPAQRPSARRTAFTSTEREPASQRVPRWVVVPRRDLVRGATTGAVEVELLVPQLSVPPGTFCCCCLSRLVCAECGNSSRLHRSLHRLHNAWTWLATTLADLSDRAALLGVAHGSSEERECNPQDTLGRIGMWLTVLTVVTTVLSVFTLGAFAASCGCILHP